MIRPFEIRRESRAGNAARIAVAGELDVATGLEIKHVIAEMLGDGIRHVIADLREVEFVDSSGMGALLWAAHRLGAVGGDLRLVNVDAIVARTFELGGLDQVIAITRA